MTTLRLQPLRSLLRLQTSSRASLTHFQPITASLTSTHHQCLYHTSLTIYSAGTDSGKSSNTSDSKPVKDTLEKNQPNDSTYGGSTPTQNQSVDQNVKSNESQEKDVQGDQKVRAKRTGGTSREAQTDQADPGMNQFKKAGEAKAGKKASNNNDSNDMMASGKKPHPTLANTPSQGGLSYDY